MDPIRPIGPLERDLEPVVQVTRSSPDARRERPDPRDEAQPRPAPRQRPAPPDEPPDDENGTSLIDVRV
ncbi:MAG: hypothetical protein QOH76_750 [Thermoleophilaceae bacterium]|jgi:hypothetical protein|nr:hypothetical protein [Thermoleophilaceae bacterium]